MRVAGKWQRHTGAQRVQTYTYRTAFESVKSSACLAFSSPYYSAVVARRYLKSGMANTNTARQARCMLSPRASLTVGFYCYSKRSSRRLLLPARESRPLLPPRICDRNRRLLFALSRVECRRSEPPIETHLVLDCNHFAQMMNFRSRYLTEI